MDSIWSCAFGIDANIQENPENEYNRRSEAIFMYLAKENAITYVTNYLHEFQNIIINLALFSEKYLNFFMDIAKYDPLYWFMNNLFKIVEIRKSNSSKRKDYLQLLIDAEADIDNKKLALDFDNSIPLDKKLSTNVNLKKNYFFFKLN